MAESTIMLGRSAPGASARRPEPDGQGEDGISRRNALISIGKYAAYVTPAMTVLVRGSTTLANHSCNNPNQGQGHSCIP
jgi:hypothetical protein